MGFAMSAFRVPQEVAETLDELADRLIELLTDKAEDTR